MLLMPFYDTDESGGGNAQQTEANQNTDTQGSTGNQQQQQTSVDYSKINPTDLPLDLIKQHPEYQKVLTETIDRRKQIAKMREQFDAAEGVKPEVKPIEQVQQPVAALDAETLALLSDIRKERAVKAERDAVKPLATKHNVPEEYWDMITGSTDAEKEAKAIKLGALALKSGTSTGNAGASGGDDAASQRIIARLKGDADPLKATNPFDPGIQRQKGGGTN